MAELKSEDEIKEKSFPATTSSLDGGSGGRGDANGGTDASSSTGSHDDAQRGGGGGSPGWFTFGRRPTISEHHSRRNSLGSGRGKLQDATGGRGDGGSRQREGDNPVQT